MSLLTSHFEEHQLTYFFSKESLHSLKLCFGLVSCYGNKLGPIKRQTHGMTLCREMD